MHNNNPLQQGLKMHSWAKTLWPLNRSLTGPGTRATLDYIAQLLPNLKRHSIASQTQVFDWQVPDEWSCEDAYIQGPDGSKLCQLSDNNLHLVGYSTPVDKQLDLTELQTNLHSLPDYPEYIPYVTSYYQKNWGFCLSHNDRKMLPEGNYRAVIKSRLFRGKMDYAELVIPGKTDKEILLSTNICHPSMANNELSGPIMLAALAQWLQVLPQRHFTYRMVFLPETIGAVAYLHKHLNHLKEKVVAGYQVVCCGDERTLSYIASPYGDNASDRVAKNVLAANGSYQTYSFLHRGSDERQYCAPGIRLPIASITCSKYGEYPEYHNSGDDLERVVTPAGLQKAFDIYRQCLEALEAIKPDVTANSCDRQVTPCNPMVTVLCEPQLGKRGLYGNFPPRDPLSAVSARTIINIIAYCDGTNSAAEIASFTETNEEIVDLVLQRLKEEALVTT